MGRPAFEFTDEKIRMVEEMAAVGLSIERMSGVLGIGQVTFHKYKNQMPEINEAIERGKGKASFTIGKSLFNRARDGDVPAIKWFEQTRDERAERTRNEVTGKDGEPLGVVSREPMTADEWENRHGKPEEKYNGE